MSAVIIRPLPPALDLADNPGQKAPVAVIYLDHNASSPLLPVARAAWLDAEERYPGNPSSPHRLGARAESALEQARHQLASILGCSPLDITWTSGATEACNAVIAHVAATGDRPTALIGALEHPAVLESARTYFGSRMSVIRSLPGGVIDLEWLRTEVAQRKPALVAVMAANNETGIIQPWRDIRELCAAHGAAFFCDATQWCGREPSAGLGACDFVAGSAHKFGGPRGVGFLKAPAAPSLRPLLRGGHQQEGRRAGTENVAGVVAMLAALQWCEQQIAAGAGVERQGWRRQFEQELPQSLPGAAITGLASARLWNTVAIVLPEVDCRQRWVVKLDRAGFAVSTGSACASGSEQPSHVLTAMGFTPNAAARAVRLSSGWLTPRTDWTAARAAMVRIQHELTTAAAVA